MYFLCIKVKLLNGNNDIQIIIYLVTLLLRVFVTQESEEENFENEVSRKYHITI